MVPGRQGLWIKEQGMEESVREVFSEIIKMAILFAGIAIIFIWVENKLMKKIIKRRRVKK